MSRIGLIALLVLASCKLYEGSTVASPQSPSRVRRIILSPRNATVHVGAQLTLRADLLDSDDRLLNDRPRWYSSNPAVATVDSTGAVTGVAAGGTRIVVDVLPYVAESAAITVIEPVAQVVVRADTIRVPLDRAVEIPAVLLDRHGDTIRDRGVEVLSSDTTTVKPVPGGVSGRDTGTARIIVTAEGQADTAVAKVYRWPAALRVSPDSVEPPVGTFVTFTAQLVDTRGAPIAGDSLVWQPGPGLEPAGPPGRFYARSGGATYVQAFAGSIGARAGAFVALGTVSELSASASGMCALAARGPVCWNAPRERPVLVDTTPLAVLGPATGEHRCGLDGGGRAICWGAGRSWAESPGPFDAVVTGDQFTCVLAAGAAACAGTGALGQLGSGAFASSSTLVPVAGGHRFVAITAGAQFACGLDDAGAAWCWGLNSHDELGDGTHISSATPVRAANGLAFRSMVSGAEHSCGVAASGQVKCWGRNTYGETYGTPGPFASIAAGPTSSCGLTTSGELWCWGYQNYWQSGGSSAEHKDVPFAVSAVALAANQMCAVSAAGRVFCSGAFAPTPFEPLPGDR